MLTGDLWRSEDRARQVVAADESGSEGLNMGGIAGIVQFNDTPVDPRDIEAMTNTVPHRGDALTWIGPSAHLAQMARPHGEPRQPLESEVGTVLIADARIDNRRSLTSQLRKDLRTDSPSDADLIQAAYLRWGPDCAAHLIGDFAFVVWDGRSKRLFAARDPMGMRPLYYRSEGQQLIFGSEVKQILVVSGVPTEPNEVAIAGYLAGPISPPDWSFYQGIDQLAPAHRLIADVAGMRSSKYWEADPERRVRYRRRKEYAEELRSLLSDAVRARIRGPGAIGVSLSGGLDSGLVASMIGRTARQGGPGAPTCITFSWAFDDLRDADERAISSVIADHYGLEAIDVPGDDAWPLSSFPEHGPDRDDPQIKVYQALTDRTLEAAASRDVRVMLTGDRGDEMVGDRVFDYLGLLRTGQILTLRSDLGARAADTGTTTAMQFKRQILRPLVEGVARHPLGSRLTPHSIGDRVKPLRPSYPDWVPAEFLRRTSITEVLASADTQVALSGSARRARYGRIFSPSGARIALTTERNHAAFGLEYADPWSDRKIAEFVLAIPQWVLQTYRNPKGLARDAAIGVVPERARMQARKTIPYSLFDRGFKVRERSTVLDLLNGSIAADLGYIDTSAVRSTYDAYLAGQPFQWDFWWPLTLEMWLRRWWQ